jgi:hypothetical protein
VLIIYLSKLKNKITYVTTNMIWHKTIPLKVSLFDWRLLQNHLPTKDNLIRQGVLQNKAQLCVGGYGSYEDVDHPFTRCEFFGTVWILVSQWIAFSTIHPACLLDHFLQFCHFRGASKYFRSILYLLCFLAFG